MILIFLWSSFFKKSRNRGQNYFATKWCSTDGTVVRRLIVLLQLPKEDNSFIDICTALFCIRCIYYMIIFFRNNPFSVANDDDLRRFLVISSTKHTLCLQLLEIVERSPETLSRVHPPNHPSIVVTKVPFKTFNNSALLLSPNLLSKRVNIYEISLFRPNWPTICARLVSNKYFFFAKPKYHPACRVDTRCMYCCI